MTEDLTSPKDNQPEESSKPGKAKKTRRGHGEGSIYRRASDGRFAASLTLEDGKRKTFYGKTKAEVRAKLEKAKLEKQQGILATGPNQTLGQYLTYWIENIHKPPLIRESSYLTYRERLRVHILPALGHIKLTKLKVEDLDKFYAGLMKKGLALSYIRNIHGVLSKALLDAERRNKIARNPCRLIDLPKAPKFEAQALTREQARALIDTIKKHRRALLFFMALLTGMRIGEVLGLKWQDINFEDGLLQIQRTLHWNTGKGFWEGPPKSAGSKRKIALPPLLIEGLKQHRTRQVEIRHQAGTAWKGLDLVFCNNQGGYLHDSSVRYTLYSLLRRANVPRVRFHDLRHSASTLLESLNIHPKVVQELLGHSRMQRTLDYTHPFIEEQRAALKKLSELFEGSE